MLLQVPHAALAAVGADERVQRGGRQLQLRRAQAAVLPRRRHQVLLRYRQLLLRYVTWSTSKKLGQVKKIKTML